MTKLLLAVLLSLPAAAGAVAVPGAQRTPVLDIQFSTGTTDTSIGTTEAGIPQSTITVTTNGETVYLLYNIRYRHSTGTADFTEFRIRRDGTQVALWAKRTGNNGESSVTSLAYVDSPPAGTHEYVVTWRANGGIATREAISNSFEGSTFVVQKLR